MRRRAGAAAVAAALTLIAAGALAGGAGAARGRAEQAAAPGWAARFFARTTRPKADTAWDYCVVVVDKASLAAVEAHVLQRLFDSSGNPIATVGQADAYGAWCNAIKLPASIKGQAITLETKVTGPGGEQRLRTPIRVT